MRDHVNHEMNELGFSDADADRRTITRKGYLFRHWRMPLVLATLLRLSLGYSIIISMSGIARGSHLGLAYFVFILAATGIYPLSPAVAAWTDNNLAPARSQALGLAWNGSFLNSAGIVGTSMFFDADPRVYNTVFGLSLTLGLTSCTTRSLGFGGHFPSSSRKIGGGLRSTWMKSGQRIHRRSCFKRVLIRGNLSSTICEVE